MCCIDLKYMNNWVPIIIAKLIRYAKVGAKSASKTAESASFDGTSNRLKKHTGDAETKLSQL